MEYTAQVRYFDNDDACPVSEACRYIAAWVPCISYKRSLRWVAGTIQFEDVMNSGNPVPRRCIFRWKYPYAYSWSKELLADLHNIVIDAAATANAKAAESYEVAPLVQPGVGNHGTTHSLLSDTLFS